MVSMPYSYSYCVNCGEDGIAVFCYSTGEERAYFSARTTNADVCVSGLASAQCMLVLAGGAVRMKVCK